MAQLRCKILFTWAFLTLKLQIHMRNLKNELCIYNLSKKRQAFYAG